MPSQLGVNTIRLVRFVRTTDAFVRITDKRTISPHGSQLDPAWHAPAQARPADLIDQT
jgi:hypothetical protein